MFRKSALLLVTASALVLGACTPMTTYSGFQVVESNPADVKVGEDTKSTVLSKLGSPSATSLTESRAAKPGEEIRQAGALDSNLWFYVSQVTDRVAFYTPRVAKRDVVAVSFSPDGDQVESVNVYTLEDGKVIAFNGRETPTRGREITILEQLLGNVGQGGILPRDDSEGLPGSRPGDTR
ncbi:MAG: outer membrane protein assembly factor BamE [Caulobacteraceae bacterium]|jgi:outer membrane protein assembly factor BamE (lipoprotein component of BamABCDE complex)|nr:outer membrane protein assembly factor BamE [Caulobacteraceae bacterium]